MPDKLPPPESNPPAPPQESGQRDHAETPSHVPEETQAYQGGAGPAPEPARPRPADFLAPAEGPDELGRLGGYRVLKELGAGGMGIVFAAQDVQLRRPVALKVMQPALCHDVGARERFLREAQAAAALRHEHVVTIYQVGESRGIPFLAMEFLQGETLQDRLEREGQQPIGDVLNIGRQVAEGLAAAHELGLIHRDIKPGNIWLETRGEGRGAKKRPSSSLAPRPSPLAPSVKILDFGLARREEGEARLTQSGVAVGTPHFMAPEQAAGDHVDHRCDLFSLGCVLYRMVTGQLPFTGTNMRSVMKAVMFEAPPPVRGLAHDLPPALVALIERLLAKEPADRPQSAQEVAEALSALEAERAASGERRGQSVPTTLEFPAVAAQTGTPPAQATMSARRARRRRLVTAVISLACLGLGGLWLAPRIYHHFTAAPNAIPADGSTPPAATEPFVVLARAGSPERDFASLAEAVAAAQSGDIIEVNADGPPITRPIKITGRALIIRAAPGTAPMLLLKRETPEYPALNIETDSPLTLEGLAFHAIDPTPAQEDYHVLMSNEAPLRVVNCRFVDDVARPNDFIFARRSQLCEIRNCQVALKSQGSAFLNCSYVSNGQLVFDNNAIAGPGHALYFWPFGGAATAEASFQLTRNSMAKSPIGFILYHASGGQTGEKRARSMHVDARENAFGESNALSFAQLHDTPTRTGAEAEALLKRLLDWREQRNAYPERDLLYLGKNSGQGHVQIAPTKERKKVKEWEEFWGISNTGSLQGTIQFQGGDLAKRAQDFPLALKPEHFRLAADSVGKGKGKDGKDLGADVDLVGPGPAYEKWKQTDAYQYWLKDTGEALSADPDRRAAQWVLGIGGTVRVNEQDQDIKATAELPKQSFRLTWVDLHETKQVDDAGLASFKACKNVSGLRLDNTQVTDTGLAYFKDCKNLKMLHLNLTQVGDAGLTHFKDCKELTGLYLSGTQVTDVGLAQFKHCTNLANLQLGHTKVTDAGLAHFKDHRNLFQVMLNGTQITDVGLAHFKDCRNLTHIYLPSTRVSDAGLESLIGCRAAQLIHLKGTQVTGAGVKKFSAALPRCKIEWEGGVIEPRPFVVLTQGSAPDRGFATLAAAVAAAQSGDTIEVNADGPPITKLIRIRDKALTIRAAPGAAPTLLLKREAVTDPEVNIMTDSPLTLEGLAFHAIGPSPPAGNWFLRSEEAPLQVAGCKFTSELQGAVYFVQAQGSQRCEVRNCQAIVAQGGAALFAWEYGSNGQLVLDNNASAGFGHVVVLRPYGNAKEATFHLSRNSMAAAPMALMLRENAPPVEKANRSLRVDSRENVMAQGGFSFAQYQDKPSATYAEAAALLKGLLQWTEQRNAHPEWLPIYLAKRGKPFDPTKGSLKLPEWEAFWGIENTGSMQGPIVFQGGDLRTKAKDSPAALVPADFRLAEGSLGKRGRADGKDLGADLDLVGPGPAYERWKKTPKYQQWLKDAMPTKTAPAVAEPFVVLAKGGKAQPKFATLVGAVTGAGSGDTIEIHGSGPFVVTPLEIGKALIIRAGAGCWPVLKCQGKNLSNSVILAHAPLVLEGLEFQRDDRGRQNAGPSWLIVTDAHSLDVANCRFVCSSKDKGATPLLSSGQRCTVRNCQFIQSPYGYKGAWVPPPGGRAILENNILGEGSKMGWDVGLEFHYRHGQGVAPRDVAVRFARNTCNGFPFALYVDSEPALGAAEDLRAARPFRFEATDNILDTTEGILGFFQCQATYPPKTAKPLPVPEAKTLLKHLLDWREQRNALPAGTHRFVRAYAQGANAPQEHQGDWLDCLPPDIDSVQGPIRYQGGNVRAKLAAAPETVTPADYRLLPNSVGYRAGKDSRDLGADVDLVGPGTAYERWKQTEAYKQWLRDTGQNN
jgi:serine/threonine protein kinase